MSAVAWVVVAEADMLDYVENKVLDAFKNKDLGVGQSDPFTNLMRATADRMRGDIGLHYTLSATAYSVPPSLKWVACLFIAEVMQGRLSVIDQNVTNFLKGHENNLKDARELMKEIRAGDATVEAPLDPLADIMQSQGESGVELVTAATRVCTHSTMEGL